MPIFELDYIDLAAVAVASVSGLRRLWWPDFYWRWDASPAPMMWTMFREPGSFEVWAGRLYVCICPPEARSRPVTSPDQAPG